MNVEIEVPKDHFVPKKWTYFICHLVPDIFRTIVRNALSRLAADMEETAVTDAAVIICQSSQFSLYSYMQSSDHDVSIVTPLWGLYSLLNEDLQPLHYYSANPQMLFSGMCFDIFHLDNCSMTDFYASVILFFGGRIAVDSTEFTTHRILELQPSKRKHPLTQIDISLSELSLMSFNSATVSLFVNYFFQLAGKGDSSKVTVRDERGFLSIEGCATRTVSFSWLDACITQRCILPETDFYTSSKHAQGRQFQPPRKVSDTPEKEFVERTNFSQPLKESYVIVCQRIRKRIAEQIEKAAIWLGAVILKKSPNDLTDAELGVITIVTTDRRPYLNCGLSCIYVSPYFISKLLSVDGGLPYSPLDRSTSSASNTLQQYLEIIYSPPKVVEILDASGACIASGIAGLRCCIFTLDGFSAEDTEDPSRLDIEEGIRMAGGYISDCMVEGLTSYLLCRKMEGEKYAAAKSWGPKTIQVVHWTWLLKCLLTWSVVEPRDEESLTKRLSNDIEIKVDDISPERSNPMHAPYVACEDESVPLSQLSFNFYASQTSQASFTEEPKSQRTPPSEAKETIGATGETAITGIIPNSQEASSMFNLREQLPGSTVGDPRHEGAPVVMELDTVRTEDTGYRQKATSTNDIISVEEEVVWELKEDALVVLSGKIEAAAASIDTADAVDIEIKKPSRIAGKKCIPRFLFGGGSEEQVVSARSVVKALGCTSVWPVESKYDESCTHLILWDLKRTEKYLCACAAGKWILRPEYLDACLALSLSRSRETSKRVFPPEEQYEWGDGAGFSDLSHNQIQWAGAGRRWRLATQADQLGEQSSKPFANINAIIFGHTVPPAETLYRMVINGGGKAVVIPNSKCTLLIDQLVSSIKNIGIVDSVKKESLVGGPNKRKGSRKRLRGVTEYVESRDRLIEPAVCNIVTTSISPLVVLNVLVTSPQLDSNNEEQAAILALFSENGIQLLQQSPSYLLNCLCEGNPIITETVRVP